MKRRSIIAIAFMTLSCTHDVINPAKPLPVITINAPSNKEHFIKVDTIRITGMVTHSVALAEVAVHMTDLSTNNEFFHNHFSAGNKLQFSFDSKYGIPDDKKASYKIEVEALDKDGTSATKDLTITIN